MTDGAVQFTAQVPGFDAKDLEVVIGHQRAVLCGTHSAGNLVADGGTERKVMRIVELPFDVDPLSAKATLRGGIVEVVLPRSR